MGTRRPATPVNCVLVGRKDVEGAWTPLCGCVSGRGCCAALTLQDREGSLGVKGARTVTPGKKLVAIDMVRNAVIDRTLSLRKVVAICLDHTISGSW